MTRTRSAILTILLALALAVPACARASVTWTLNGGGFGHGVGMSAYGAYGYGLHGYGYRQILHHYFRSIRIEPVRRAPLVRVLLTASPSDVSFSHATEACGRTLNPKLTYRAHRRGSSVRLLSGSGRLLGGCGRRLHADSAGWLAIAGVGAYRGALEAVPDPSSGSLDVVNALNLNNYARGSLPAEVPPEWPAATLKAFAVAIRSIALSTDVGGSAFDLYSDTRTQNYGGIGAESDPTDAAVRATQSQVVTYGGDVAQTTYFSSSGGITESHFPGAPQAPYLESVRDPYDYYSPQHRWKASFSEAEIDSRLGGYLDGALKQVRVTKRGASPRIESAKLIGTRGTTTVSGEELEAALGLYSSWIYFKKVVR